MTVISIELRRIAVPPQPESRQRLPANRLDDRHQRAARSRGRPALSTNAQLAFHRLVADVAARFGAIAPEAVDDAIVDSLRQTGEALQLDWAVLWRRHSGEAMAVPDALLGASDRRGHPSRCRSHQSRRSSPA